MTAEPRIVILPSPAPDRVRSEREQRAIERGPARNEQLRRALR